MWRRQIIATDTDQHETWEGVILDKEVGGGVSTIIWLNQDRTGAMPSRNNTLMVYIRWKNAPNYTLKSAFRPAGIFLIPRSTTKLYSPLEELLSKQSNCRRHVWTLSESPVLEFLELSSTMTYCSRSRQQFTLIVFQSDLCPARPSQSRHPTSSLHDVFRVTTVAKLTYCAPAWSSWCSAADLARLDSFLRRCQLQNYCDNDLPSITQLFGEADDTLFRSILTNKQHVLQSFLSERPNVAYNFRDRSY